MPSSPLHEIEGEHGEIVLAVGCHGRLKAPEIRVAFAGGEDKLAVNHCGLARDDCQRSGQVRQTLRVVVAAPAEEPQLLPVFDDLEAVSVELRLMEPRITARDGLGGCGDTRSDELQLPFSRAISSSSRKAIITSFAVVVMWG